MKDQMGGHQKEAFQVGPLHPQGSKAWMVLGVLESMEVLIRTPAAALEHTRLWWFECPVQLGMTLFF